MGEVPLFRSAAIEARKAKWLGDIVLIRPVSFTVLSTIALVCAVIVLLFLFFGTYTKHSTVSGQLISAGGQVKVYTQQAGIVIKKYVVEGQSVKKGQPLFLLSSDRHDAEGDVQEKISSHVHARQQSLQIELSRTKQLQDEERKSLVENIAGLDSELSNLGEQIKTQGNRLKLQQEDVERFRGLLAQGYISKAQLQQKEADFLDQQIRLNALERDRINVERDLTSSRNDLATLNLKQQTDLAQINRTILATAEEFAESEGKRQIIVTAPEEGIATAITAEVGQAVDINRPIASVVPSGAPLQAYVYVPSQKIGFIKPGDEVLLRYQAYPYQKFGHAKGTVASVAKTALSASDLSAATVFPDRDIRIIDQEPLYLVIVNLASQTVKAYGKDQPLQSGMLLDADIVQETRHLYEWVLEPLYSVTGRA